ADGYARSAGHVKSRSAESCHLISVGVVYNDVYSSFLTCAVINQKLILSCLIYSYGVGYGVEGAVSYVSYLLAAVAHHAVRHLCRARERSVLALIVGIALELCVRRFLYSRVVIAFCYKNSRAADIRHFKRELVSVRDSLLPKSKLSVLVIIVNIRRKLAVGQEIKRN